MRCVSSLHLYKGIHRREFDRSGLREFLEELSSPLPYVPPLFLFLSGSAPMFEVMPAS
jgi:hypothetical protein